MHGSFASKPRGGTGAPGAVPDKDFTGLFAEGADGAPFAAVFAFGCHPTLAARQGTRPDGDWPSWAARRIDAARGVALFLQGALGDATATPPPGNGAGQERMDAMVAEAVAGSIGTARPLP